MQFRTSRWMLCFAVVMLTMGCTAANKQPAVDRQPEADRRPAAAVNPPDAGNATATDQQPDIQAQSFAGWYMERAGQGLFQACGQSRQWRVSGSPELRSKARDFGLEENTPVYVRVTGTQAASGNELAVSQVEQFGSTTPVRNCGMTGVVIPAPVSN